MFSNTLKSFQHGLMVYSASAQTPEPAPNETNERTNARRLHQMRRTNERTNARRLRFICLSRTPARSTTAPRALVDKMRKNGFTKGTRRTVVLGYECPAGVSSQMGKVGAKCCKSRLPGGDTVAILVSLLTRSRSLYSAPLPAAC